jgi:hypothetical protein
MSLGGGHVRPSSCTGLPRSGGECQALERLAREDGALTVLALAATYRAGVLVHAGEFDAADALIGEAAAITEVTGNAALAYTSLVLAA